MAFNSGFNESALVSLVHLAWFNICYYLPCSCFYIFSFHFI